MKSTFLKKFIFWPHDAASGVLVPWVGIEPETLQ